MKYTIKELLFLLKRIFFKFKKIMVRISLMNILLKLGIGNLDLNSLSSIIFVKIISFILKFLLKFKLKLIVVFLKIIVIMMILF